MEIFKSAAEIKQKYKDAKMKSENLEMYEDVEKILKGEIKHTDKLEKQYDQEEKDKKYYDKKYEKTVEEIKKLKEKHPVKTAMARIPLVGRLGKVGKEYRSLRDKAKRAKKRAKIAKRNLKDLKAVCKKAQKDLKLAKKDLKRCQKTLKRTYKADKYNIKISEMYGKKKEFIERAYDKDTVKYIKEYVKQIRDGEREVELPKNIGSEKEFCKKLEKDIKRAIKGKEISAFAIEKEVKKAQEEKTTEKKDNKTIFATRGLDIKREYVTMEKETKDGKIALSPEETLNFLGFISKEPQMLEEHSKEELMAAIKADEKLGFADRGWDVLHEMIERIKDEKQETDPKDLSQSEKAVYKVAKKYVEREQKAKEKEQEQKAKAKENDEQQQYA